MMFPPEVFSQKERFWRKVWKREPDQCWPWLASANYLGYGVFRVKGFRNNVMAHRVAYQLSHEEVCLTEKDKVSHIFECKDRSCVNPNHLAVMSKAEIIVVANKRKMEKYHKGEVVHGGKLTSKDVLDIRASKYSRDRLALKYGVSLTHITGIINRRKWKELTKKI